MWSLPLPNPGPPHRSVQVFYPAGFGPLQPRFLIFRHLCSVPFSPVEICCRQALSVEVRSQRQLLPIYPSAFHQDIPTGFKKKSHWLQDGVRG